jgi:hypothetical protein
MDGAFLFAAARLSDMGAWADVVLHGGVFGGDSDDISNGESAK